VKLEKSPKEKKVHYIDLWGLREEKYRYLFGNDVQTTIWQELKPVAPYYFFVPKDFALQSEYEKFWKITDIFKKWSSGVKTHRDHFVVGFVKEEILQRLRVFTGNLTDELVKEGLKLKDTRDWKLREAREKAKRGDSENKIYSYAYRPFDDRKICYESLLIDRDRWPFTRHLLKENISLALMRRPIPPNDLTQVLAVDSIADINFYAYQTYFFPLYLYPEQPKDQLFSQEKSKSARIPNFTDEFLRTVEDSVGEKPTPEEIFYYIYAVLYCPTYRKRYSVPLPSNIEMFKELSNLGKELIDLHLLKAPGFDETEIGFPRGGSNIMAKVFYDEENQRVFINKEQYFEGVSKEVWSYRIGAYQVMEKYLKDRKTRKLSLNEINHYMKMTKAIRLTSELQEGIDELYRKLEI
jgi:predicted helicase